MLEKQLLSEAKQNLTWFFVTIVAGLASGVLALLQAYWIARIVSQVFIEHAKIAGMYSWFGYLLAIMVARPIVTWLGETAAAQFAAAVKEHCRQKLIRHMYSLGPVNIKRYSTGELMNLLTSGIDNLEPYFSQYLPQLVMTAAIPLLALAVIFPVDAVSAMLLLITAPFIPLFMILVGRWAAARQKKQWDRFQRLSGHFLDVLRGLTTLKIFGRSREQAQVIQRFSSELSDSTLAVLKVAFLSAFMLELLSTISTAIVAVTVGLRLLQGSLAFEQAFFVLLAVPEFYLPLRALGLHYHAGMAGAEAAKKMSLIIGSKPETQSDGCSDVTQRAQQMLPDGANASDAMNGANHRQTPVPGVPWMVLTPRPLSNAAISGEVCFAGYDIVFENVSYRYEGRSENALKNISFKVNQGEKIALVGPSGAGKSTIAALLLGFISPQQGQIRLAGRPLSEMTLSSLVTYLPQFPHIFSGTVADNIRVGEYQASLTEVINAAVKAGAHDFICRLPQGYETVIGDGGTEISGGERQRLALARAFLRDTPYIIMDEPTSGLDPDTEAGIRRSLKSLFDGKTVVIIAHRITTTTNADNVIVLQAGTIFEMGKPAELWEMGNLYYEMVAAYRGEFGC